MKLTKEVLKQIIKEEIQAVLNEEETVKITPKGAETHRKNLEMAKTMNAKELAASMKLPDGLPDLNSYKKFNDPLKGGNMKLAKAINLAMRSPAAKKIAGTRM